MISTDLEVITPHKAKTYLSRNSNNRPLNPKHAKWLAHQMPRDWSLNGDSIKFDRHGNLLDGQHRLHACVISGAHFQTVVTRNVESAAFDTIDTGRRRSPADVLAIRGEANVAALGAIARTVVHYGMNPALTEYPTLPNRAYERAVSEMPSLRFWAKAQGRLRAMSSAPSAVAATLAICETADEARAQQLFESLATGANLTSTDPALHLRDTLMRAKIDKMQSMSAFATIALTVYAWNAISNGRKLTRVSKPRGEVKVPTIHGVDWSRFRNIADHAMRGSQ